MSKKKNKVSTKEKKKKRKTKEIKSKKKIIKKESDLEENIQEGSAKSSLGKTEEIKFREFLAPQSISAPTLNKIAIQEPLEINVASSPIPEEIKDQSQRGIYTSSKDAQKYSPEVVVEKEENKYQETSKSDFFGPTRFEEKRATGLTQEINPLETEAHKAINPNVGTIDSFEEVEKKYKEGEF